MCNGCGLKRIASVGALLLFLARAGWPQGNPYGLIFLDFGGDVFTPGHSAPSKPSVPCPSHVITQFRQGCTEELSAVRNFRFGIGVRPIRHLQIDAFDANILGNFNGFGNKQQTFQCVSGCTGSTILTVGSVHALFTTGARAVLPLWQERILISGGAGWGWLRTFERAEPTSTNQKLIGCSGGPVSCLSASGNGPTEIVAVMYMPSPHIGIGVHYRNVQIRSSGLDANGLYSNANFGTTFKDRFSLIGAEISVRFGERH